MQIIAAFFLFLMVSATIVWQQAILLKFADTLYAAETNCPRKIWQFNENPHSFCLPPRSDHGFLDGRRWRAAGAICWYVLRSSLPRDSVFHPDSEDHTKAYRCDFP